MVDDRHAVRARLTGAGAGLDAQRPGDDYAIVFSPAGAWVRVFDHESTMSPWGLEPPRPWPGVLDTVPAAFQACLQELAFTLDGVVMVNACREWHACGTAVEDDVGYWVASLAPP